MASSCSADQQQMGSIFFHIYALFVKSIGKAPQVCCLEMQQDEFGNKATVLFAVSVCLLYWRHLPVIRERFWLPFFIIKDITECQIYPIHLFLGMMRFCSQLGRVSLRNAKMETSTCFVELFFFTPETFKGNIFL